MSPYPIDPPDARGPMRLVLTTYPDRAAAVAQIEAALERRLAACASIFAVDSRFRWKGRIETSSETMVLFKTAPKRVGALFRLLKDGHPYEVPEIVELDVPRAHPGFLEYLAQEIDPDAPPPPLGGGPTRRGGPRARGARSLGRTRARPLHRLRGTGRKR
ncbi:MAG: divalent-cation tolerance protein CutA [Thermoplasmata archaeon]|nr:divalent-cation tolerance protein CutA [Thermoplasmata archaeon]